MTFTAMTKTLVAAGCVTLLSGCGIYQKYDASRVDSQLVKDYAQALTAADTDSTALGNLRWQQVFTDPVLADLIERALEHNKDLRNAKLNIDMAHAQLKGARLSYLPSVAFAPNGAGASYAGSKMNWTYQLPLSVGWEIDVFGKLLNNKRSAEVSELQAKAYEQAVRSQIIAGVATCYYTIASLESQLALLKETAKLWNESVTVMRNLKEAGRLREDAVVQSQAAYYSVEASLTDIEDALVQANNSMSLLMNTMPTKWAIPADAALNVPSLQRAAIPMYELAARPDVRAAEMQLAVAYYATASARSAFYPSLNINANGGFTNLLGSFVKNPGDWFVQLAGSLTAPLFSRGANIARLEASKASQQQALNNFEYTLMSAAADVSNAMSVFESSQQKKQWLAMQVDSYKKAVDITNELLLFDGSTTYLEVLTAQRNLLSAQTSQITTNLTAAQAIINLYQNLGGGR